MGELMHTENRGWVGLPEPTGVHCDMMPFVQGDPSSLPDWCGAYAAIVAEHALERGEIGFITVQESRVVRGHSQRGYSRVGAERNVHVEVGHGGGALYWGPAPSWGGRGYATLDPSTRVLIANSVSGTCRVWDCADTDPTPDGDLGDRLDAYPERSGALMEAGDLHEIGILTPHECVPQLQTGWRQFVRIVGAGVSGRENHFTTNPRLGSL